MMGLYNMKAMVFAIDHCLNGIKAQSKYYGEPLMRQQVEVTEETIQNEVELFFAKESARRVNWKRNHSKSKDGTGS